MSIKHSYALTHFYAKDKSKYNVKFKTTLRQFNLCETIAYIQFLTDDIAHMAELEAIDTVLLLKAFYDNELEFIDMNELVERVIDEYDNWEFYSPATDTILGDKDFHREGLREAIKRLLARESL